MYPYFNALKHGDDQLTILLDPEEESLFLVVEDVASIRPVPLHVGIDQVPIPINKQEVVAGQVLLQVSEGFRIEHVDTLLLGDSETDAEHDNASYHPDPGGSTGNRDLGNISKVWVESFVMPWYNWYTWMIPLKTEKPSLVATRTGNCYLGTAPRQSGSPAKSSQTCKLSNTSDEQ